MSERCESPAKAGGSYGVWLRFKEVSNATLSCENVTQGLLPFYTRADGSAASQKDSKYESVLRGHGIPVVNTHRSAHLG